MQKRLRFNNGYSLVSIISIGAASLLLLMALAFVISNSTRAVAKNKYIDSLRNAAETGIDYAVAKYNSEFPCTLDPGTQDSSGHLTTLQTPLPSNNLEFGDATAGAPNIKVTITVTELASPSDWQMLKNISSVYSTQLDPTSSSIPLNVPDGGFRIIESTADNGILSRTIRVILRASLSQPISQSDHPPSTPTIPSNASQASYFNIPMLSYQTMNLIPRTGNLTVQGYNSQTAMDNPMHTVTPTLKGQASYNAYDLNIQTNQNVLVGSTSSFSSTINGDVVVSNTSSPNSVASTQNGIIQGRLITNGTVDNTSVQFTSDAATPKGTDTVLANADISPSSPSRVGQNFSSPVAEGQSTSASLTPAAVTPFSAVSLPSLASIVNTVQPPLPNGSPQPPPNISPGQYESQGLFTDAMQAPIVIQNGATTSSSSAVKIFVNSVDAPSAVNLDTSKITFQNPNGDARNFQIFYEGTEPVNINIASASRPFTGLIYAPNAAVTISGSGTFNGAAVAAQLNVTMAGTMKLYTDLAATSGTVGATNAASGLQYLTVPSTQPGVKGPVQMVQGWVPITWQEFTAGSNF